jgi:hypothetical protein
MLSDNRFERKVRRYGTGRDDEPAQYTRTERLHGCARHRNRSLASRDHPDALVRRRQLRDGIADQAQRIDRTDPGLRNSHKVGSQCVW